MKILDLSGSWWLWKWFLTSGATKRLFNHDLKYGVVCDQRASQPWNWSCNADQRASQPRFDERQPKGFSPFDLEERRSKGFFNLEIGTVCNQRSSLPQSKVVEMSIKGLFYLHLELLKCRSKVFSTSIWNCWNVDQRSSLLQSGLAGKGLLYFNLNLLKCRSKVFLELHMEWL